MVNGFHVAEIRGIDIRINWSVLVIGLLVAASLSNSFLPEIAEGYSTAAYWTAGILATIAFFAGLLAHELGHSIVALNDDVDVTSITLWLFGGVAQLASPPKTPSSSMRIAAAGPAVSAALGVIGLTLGAIATGLVGATLVWFGIINLALAVFNLLPAFPLDGGRIYHAWLWARTGDSVQATEQAARLGTAIGVGLVGLGLLQVLFGGFVGGLWLMMIGLFVREAARSEMRSAVMRTPLRETTVSEVMTPNPETVDASSSVEDFVDRFLTESRHATYPVVTADGSPVGLITLATLRNLPRSAWPETTVGMVATPASQLQMVPPGTTMADVIQTRGFQAGERVLVIDDGALVGIVAPSDIARWVSILEIVSQPDPARRSPS